MTNADWTLDDLIYRAEEEGAGKIHLVAGAPPMLRRRGEDLFPAGPYPPLTSERIARELSTLVEPEAWHRIETIGEGDLTVHRLALSLRLTLYRTANEWAVVVHL
ncbi:MAG: hypothetical protein PWP23_2435 [Candidatus Sumerlaeota bacterium]|nr:hypothetical protein [Candidatus Sumerlaeota bacterium]